MFSILITVFNRQDLLDRQLAYLSRELSDFEFPYEIIVYDDCSSVPLVINSTNPFVRFFRGEVNLGLIEARNRLISFSSDNSNYFLFLDDDIFIFNLVDAMHRAMFFIDSGYSAFSIPYVNLPIEYRAKLSWFKYVYDFKKLKNEVVFFNGGTTFFDSKIFAKLGGLEGRYRIYLEEEDFALRLFSIGKKIRIATNESFVAIHDQPKGKIQSERDVFLLSNRMSFHRKFINSKFLVVGLNVAYIILFLFKKRKFKLIRDAHKRYVELSTQIKPAPIKFGILFKFMIRRFFNI